MTLLFENPTVFSLETENMAFRLSLSEQLICVVQVSQISLSRGLQKLSFRVTLAFDDPSINPENISQMVERIKSKLFDGNYDLKLALQGPLQIDQTGLLHDITEPLALYLPTERFIAAIGSKAVAELLSDEGFRQTFKRSAFEIAVRSDKITTSTHLVLPRLLAFPPLTLNSSSRLSIGRGDIPALTVRTSPITARVDSEYTHINIDIDLIPSESSQAAAIVGQIVNPLLAVNPTVISL